MVRVQNWRHYDYYNYSAFYNNTVTKGRQVYTKEKSLYGKQNIIKNYKHSYDYYGRNNSDLSPCAV